MKLITGICKTVLIDRGLVEGAVCWILFLTKEALKNSRFTRKTIPFLFFFFFLITSDYIMHGTFCLVLFTTTTILIWGLLNRHREWDFYLVCLL